MANSNATALDIVSARMAEINERKQVSDFIENEVPTQSHLSSKRHPTADFFIIDTFDASFKDDLASMEHPIFALKAGDNRTRRYEHNGNTLTVEPLARGCATIHDKDVWIYCISALMAAKNRGEPISRTVRFTAYDYLASTNRKIDGEEYKRLYDALFRLAGTRIITNIKTGGYRCERNFGLIDDVLIIRENPDDEKSRMVAIEVMLPEWLFRSVQAKQVKTISPDYFRLRKPLDRRIYEICAKHCGRQPSWSISLELLHKKSGSTAPLRNFRVAVKSLAASNELPDYRLKYDEKTDTLKVRNMDLAALLRSVKK